MSRALKRNGWNAVLAGVLLGLAATGAHSQANSPTVSVAIRAPAPGAVITYPGAVQLGATASVNRNNWQILEVGFYAGGTLIGRATTAPYRLSWTDVPAGTYTVTAQAIASAPAPAKALPPQAQLPTWTGVSAPVSFRVNAPPTVSLAAPAAGAVFNPPGAITVTAHAADSDGTIAKVEFYQGAALIGTATSAPYSVSWANPDPGTYSLTAQATDNDGAVTTSGVVGIRVNASPTVSLTAPAAGTVVSAGANFTMTATAADTDGSVATVDFYQGADLVGTATAAPYSFTLTNLAVGTHNLRAVATDNDGASTISAAVSIRVNAPPTVSLTSPTAGASVTAPASITLSATAADVDGTIANVEFWQEATLLATLNSAPYTYAWGNMPAGSYSLTARARDNDGAITTSAAVNVTVTSGVAQMYYIQVDHLNTPRLIADATGTTVWRWDQQEPFGNDSPNGDLNAAGTSFDFPMRFPGQYFDRETGLSYNYFRDYDSSTGRYIQFDPIGLSAGVNGYAYAFLSPQTFADPTGLDVTVCTYPGSFYNPFGHVGVGVNSASTVGLYPKKIGVAGVLTPTPGAIRPDTNVPPDSCKVISTSKEQDEAVAQFIREREEFADWYQANARNCVAFVRSALQAAGINTPTTILPNVLLKGLPGQRK